MHEAAHLAAALHSNFPVNFAEITNVSHRRTDGNVHCFFPDESDKSKATFIFVSLAGIAMNSIYHLTPFGVGGDWKNVRKYLAAMQKTENIEKKLTWKARQFVVKHKEQIFKLAHTLQVRRRLDADEAKRIYRGKQEVIVPRTFLAAVDEIPLAKWIGNSEEMRAFEQYFPGGKSGLQFPEENSKN